MIVLTVEQLLELHALVIAETGGSEGLRDLGRLEAVVAAQTQVIFGKELYSGMFEKAAALLRGIIADHAFVDGNKRTAMLCALTFLDLNGATVVAAEGEIEDFAVRVAVEQLDVPHITTWLEKHCS
ncbi:type II toxin-antitoxin system death-on-curing family toxin [Candidatus Saccharibacteria bacterium]|nr:type II toxin-antitoxin system death-on-curing family toxin [Candidatus Saccharibacteria bacterium]